VPGARLCPRRSARFAARQAKAAVLVTCAGLRRAVAQWAPGRPGSRLALRPQGARRHARRGRTQEGQGRDAEDDAWRHFLDVLRSPERPRYAGVVGILRMIARQVPGTRCRAACPGQPCRVCGSLARVSRVVLRDASQQLCCSLLRSAAHARSTLAWSQGAARSGHPCACLPPCEGVSPQLYETSKRPRPAPLLHPCIMGTVKRSAAPCTPPRQAPRFSERFIADGDALLQRLAYLHVNHANKDVRRAAGATLDAAQHQARPKPRARPSGAWVQAASVDCVD